jgi:hypothetical protein
MNDQLETQICTSNIPHIQLEAVVHEGLNIETLRRHDLRNILVRKLLQNSGLSGVIQAQHQNSCLLVGLLTEAHRERLSALLCGLLQIKASKCAPKNA